MNKSLVLLTMFLLPAAASAQYLDARNRAMGGTGVASSNYAAAGFLNPALITGTSEDDSFGFLFPSIGVTVVDEDQLVQKIDDISGLVDRAGTILDNPNATNGQRVAAVVQVNDALQDLNGRQAALEVGFGLAITLPNYDGLAWSILISSYTDAQVLASVTDNFNTLNTTNSTALRNSITSQGVILGVAVTEVGLALAHRFDLGGVGLSVGVMPKAQRIDTINYSVNVNNFEDDDFDSSQYRNDTTEFNADIGVSLNPLPNVTIGLVGRNLIEQEVDTVVANPGANQTQFTSTHVSPTVVLGAAITGAGFTLTADIDVVGIERFRAKSTSTVALRNDTQLLRAGVEYNLADILQLRGGYRTDLEDTVGDVITAGLAISPGGAFHIELAGLIGEGDTVGAALQFRMTL